LQQNDYKIFLILISDIVHNFRIQANTNQIKSKMAAHHEMTANQKQRIVQHKLDIELEESVIAWIEKVIHQRPAHNTEADYEAFIK
jgi:hypothetical protein